MDYGREWTDREIATGCQWGWILVAATWVTVGLMLWFMGGAPSPGS